MNTIKPTMSNTPTPSEDRMCDNELREEMAAVVVYDDGTAWCEDCHDANLNAADSIRNQP